MRNIEPMPLNASLTITTAKTGELLFYAELPRGTEIANAYHLHKGRYCCGGLCLPYTGKPMSIPTIPTSLSPGLQRELTSAAERTGWTVPLRRAVIFLPFILKMTPQQFDEYSAAYYQHKDT